MIVLILFFFAWFVVYWLDLFCIDDCCFFCLMIVWV